MEVLWTTHNNSQNIHCIRVLNLPQIRCRSGRRFHHSGRPPRDPSRGLPLPSRSAASPVDAFQIHLHRPSPSLGPHCDCTSSRARGLPPTPSGLRCSRVREPWPLWAGCFCRGGRRGQKGETLDGGGRKVGEKSLLLSTAVKIALSLDDSGRSGRKEVSERKSTEGKKSWFFLSYSCASIW